MELGEAVVTRRSVRGFVRRPVPREVLERLFARAQRAPSWCNIQPWRVWMVTGPARERLVEALGDAARSGVAPHPELGFPPEYREPYGTHRKECGKALYQAMGIERHDTAARWDAWLRNFEAFGAPHVAMVGIDRSFGAYAALDVGCWLQTLLLLLTEEGIATCPQASLAAFPDVVRRVLPIPDEITLLFGIALGYEDAEVPANRCRTTRSDLAHNVTFVEG
jgi:hypothetical protein